MHYITSKFTKVSHTILVLLLVAVPIFNAGISSKLYAADVTNRSVTVGSPTPGVQTSHTFSYTINSLLTVGSIVYEYCTNSPFVTDSCTAPAGFSLASTSMGSQSGLTGFAIHPNTTVNRLVVARVAAPITPPVSVVQQFNAVSNPTTARQSVFVRISTYASTDGTGVRGDSGAVVFSTADSININAFVPPYLIFCVGVTVNGNCSSVVGSYLSFGELSKNATSTVTSQFATATNDPYGYVTTVSGTTMTSGNVVIPGIGSPAPSNAGVSQFGMNLRANSSPAVGAERTGIGTGIVQPDFNVPNNFVFKNGSLVVSTLPSDFNVFTVSYITNVSDAQSPGVYTSTMTFITTVQF